MSMNFGHRFWLQVDRKHFESYLTEVAKLQERDVTKLELSDILEKVKEFSNPDYSQVSILKPTVRKSLTVWQLKVDFTQY